MPAAQLASVSTQACPRLMRIIFNQHMYPELAEKSGGVKESNRKSQALPISHSIRDARAWAPRHSVCSKPHSTADEGRRPPGETSSCISLDCALLKTTCYRRPPSTPSPRESMYPYEHCATVCGTVGHLQHLVALSAGANAGDAVCVAAS